MPNGLRWPAVVGLGTLLLALAAQTFYLGDRLGRLEAQQELILERLHMTRR